MNLRGEDGHTDDRNSYEVDDCIRAALESVAMLFRAFQCEGIAELTEKQTAVMSAIKEALDEVSR